MLRTHIRTLTLATAMLAVSTSIAHADSCPPREAVDRALAFITEESHVNMQFVSAPDVQLLDQEELLKRCGGEDGVSACYFRTPKLMLIDSAVFTDKTRFAQLVREMTIHADLELGEATVDARGCSDIALRNGYEMQNRYRGQLGLSNVAPSELGRLTSCGRLDTPPVVLN